MGSPAPVDYPWRVSTLNQRIGNRVRALRLARGLTQRQLAADAGLSATSLSRLEKGRQCPSVDGLDRISTALGCSLAVLLDFENEVDGGRDPLDSILSRTPTDAVELRRRVRLALELLTEEQ